MDTLPPSPSTSSDSEAHGAGPGSHEVQTVLGASGQRRRRRTRRRNSGARRLLQALEPIGLVLALSVMSMGVITVVEKTVPTKAEYEDEVRLAEARANMRTEVRELAETLDDGWAPSFQEGEDIFFAADASNLGVDIDPFSGLVEAPSEETEIAEPALAKAPAGTRF